MPSPRVTEILSRAEIRALTQRSNLRGWLVLVSNWLIIAATFAALAVWPHPATFVAAVVVLGTRQLALIIAMHEAAHGTLFRTRWLNDRLADWLCARPVWSDVRRYREHHLQHHAHTGTAEDPDLGLALERPMSRRALRRKILRDLVGASGVRRVIGLVLMDAGLYGYDLGGGSLTPGWQPRRGVGHHARLFVRQFGPTLVCNAMLAAILVAVGHGWVFAAWVVAYLTTFSLFVRLRALAEHACTERGDEPLLNTRTVDAGLLARATVAPLHVNRHLEHHLLPTVPWFRLPALHRLLAARGAIPAASHARGYRQVLRLVTGAQSR